MSTLDDVLTRAGVDLPPSARQALHQLETEMQATADPRFTARARAEAAADLAARTRATLEAEEAKQIAETERELARAESEILSSAARTVTVTGVDGTLDVERKQTQALLELQRATVTNNLLAVVQAADDPETLLDAYATAKLRRDDDAIRQVGAVVRGRLKALAAAERAAAGTENQSIGPMASAFSQFERDFTAWQAEHPSAGAPAGRASDPRPVHPAAVRRCAPTGAADRRGCVAGRRAAASCPGHHRNGRAVVDGVGIRHGDNNLQGF